MNGTSSINIFRNVRSDLKFTLSIFSIISVVYIEVQSIVNYWFTSKRLYWKKNEIKIVRIVGHWQVTPSLFGLFVANRDCSKPIVRYVQVTYENHNMILLFIQNNYTWLYPTLICLVVLQRNVLVEDLFELNSLLKTFRNWTLFSSRLF